MTADVFVGASCLKRSGMIELYKEALLLDTVMIMLVWVFDMQRIRVEIAGRVQGSQGQLPWSESTS